MTGKDVNGNYLAGAAHLDVTLAAIDEVAVQQCGHCCGPLAPDGQSPDFCGPDCQQAWTATQNEIVELIGYREPYDLPEHQAWQVELWSPEVTPGYRGPASSPVAMAGSISFDVWAASFGEVMPGFRAPRFEALEAELATYTPAPDLIPVQVEQPLAGRLQRLGDVLDPIVFQWPADITITTPQLGIVRSDHAASPAWDAHLERQRRLIAALFDVPPALLGGGGWLSPGGEPPATVPDTPAVTGHFDPDHEYEWRPVPYLADEQPALPVMAQLERDWQALVNTGIQRSYAARPPEVHQRRVIEQLW